MAAEGRADEGTRTGAGTSVAGPRSLSAARVRVLVDSPRDLVRAGVAQLLRDAGALVAVAGQAPVDRDDEERPRHDVVVVDLLDANGVGGCRLAALRDSGLPLVGLVPTYPGDVAARAGELRLRALVTLEASPAVLVDAVARAAASDDASAPGHASVDAASGPSTTLGLNDRERALVDLLVQGRTNAEIAVALDVSVNTVKTNIQGLYRKLGVQRRSQVVSLVLRRWPGTGERPTGPATESEGPDAPARRPASP